jgi:hypothetical protein
LVAYAEGSIVTVIVGDVPVFPTMDVGGIWPFRRIQFGKAFALYPSAVEVFEVTVRVCGGGAGLVFEVTQKERLDGDTLIELLWAIAVSRQPSAMKSTRTVKVIVLKDVFTEFSTGRRRARFHCKQSGSHLWKMLTGLPDLGRRRAENLPIIP